MDTYAEATQVVIRRNNMRIEDVGKFTGMVSASLRITAQPSYGWKVENNRSATLLALCIGVVLISHCHYPYHLSRADRKAETPESAV